MVACGTEPLCPECPGRNRLSEATRASSPPGCDRDTRGDRTTREHGDESSPAQPRSFGYGRAACPSGGGRQDERAGCYSALSLVPDGFRARLGHTMKYRKCLGTVPEVSLSVEARSETARGFDFLRHADSTSALDWYAKGLRPAASTNSLLHSTYCHFLRSGSPCPNRRRLMLNRTHCGLIFALREWSIRPARPADLTAY